MKSIEPPKGAFRDNAIGRTSRLGISVLLLVAGLVSGMPGPGLSRRAVSADALMDRHNRAWQLVGQDRFDEAIPLLQALIEEEPQFYRAYRTLAEAFRRRGSPEQAIAFFQGLADRNPRNAFAYFGLGEIYWGTQGQAQAAEAYLQCVAISPEAYPCYAAFARWDEVADQVPTIASIEKSLSAPRPSPFKELAEWTLHRIRSERRAALNAVDRALEVARPSGQDDLFATLLSLAASRVSLTSEGIEKARDLTAEAMTIYRRMDDWEGHILAADGLPGFFLRLGSKEEAFAVCEEYLSLARKLQHRRQEDRWLEHSAGVHADEGDFEGSLTFLDELRRQREATGALEGMPNLLMSAARAYRAMGWTDEAIRQYEEARRISRELRVRPEFSVHSVSSEAFAVAALGAVFASTGDYFRALQHGTEAIRLFREIGQEWQAAAVLAELGKAYSGLGDLVSARACFEESLATARKLADASMQQSILSSLGDLLVGADRPREGLARLEEALALSERTRFEPFRIHTLIGMATAHRNLGDSKRALTRATEALESARRNRGSYVTALALVETAECELVSGAIEPAEGHYAEALGLAELVGFTEVAVSARRGLARVLSRRGNVPGALLQLESAIRTLEDVRSSVPSTELRASLGSRNSAVFEETIDVLRRAFEAEEDETRRDELARRAFGYAEQGRARSFLDLLEASGARVTKGLSAEQNRRHSSLIATVARTSAAARNEDSEKTRRARAAALEELSRWARGLAATNPAFRDLRYPEPLAAGKAQSLAAAAGVTILEYSLGESRSALWLVGGRRIRWFSLPGRATIESEIRSFRRTVAGHPRSERDLEECRRKAQRVFRILFAPAERHIPAAGNLLIVPDGILHYLPFEALVDPGGVPLLERFRLAYAPSTSVFAALQARRAAGERKNGRRDLLAFGAPAFGSTGGRTQPVSPAGVGQLVLGVYKRAGNTFSPLQYARREIEAISRNYPPGMVRTFVGSEATEEALKRVALKEFRKVHFATHTVLDDEFPARTGIVLSLVNTGKEDGVLRIPEIFNLDLNTDVVVLSACQTGLGKLVRGEGVIGLTRAFMYAGSPRVVVSLWEVNDFATAELMGRFHANLQKGQSHAEALRSAKLSLVRTTQPDLRHPHFWAPFVLAGDF